LWGRGNDFVLDNPLLNANLIKQTILLSIMFDDKPNLRESYYHAVLLAQGHIEIGTNKANNELRELLLRNGSFHAIVLEKKGLLAGDDELRKTDGVEKIIRSHEKIKFPFRTLTVNDSDFPESLRKTEGATPVIYVRGDTSLFQHPSIAVVGTRYDLTQQDRLDADSVLERLVAKPYVIVSGLALGSDTLAHQYAIEHEGRTIAVIGTPLDKSYPKKNKDLQNDIASMHLLISQYPIGFEHTPIGRGMQQRGTPFVYRNKTVVALSSDGVVVIKAGDKSGTQHAIRHCLEQGKQLYVLRGNLNQGYEWTKKFKGRYKVLN